MPPKKKAPVKKKPAGKVPVPTGKKRGPAPKYDYETARSLFVEGVPTDENDAEGDRDWLTLRALSERLGIPYERMREKSARDRWSEQRSRYQIEAAQDRQKRRVETLGVQSIEFDTRSHDAAKMGLRLVSIRLGEIMQSVVAGKEAREQAILRLKAGQPVKREELWSQVRSSELGELAKAGAMFQDMGRKALGTDIEKIDLSVGGAVEHTVSVQQELERDDIDRLAGFIAAIDRSGINELLQGVEDIVEAEVVDDQEAEDGTGVLESGSKPNEEVTEPIEQTDKAADKPKQAGWRR